MPAVDLLRPSYLNGFAPRDGVPLNSGLWQGCVVALDPGLGHSGNTIYDWSGRRNNGTLVNLPTTGWAVGERGYALDFSATNDYLTVPYDANYATPCVSWSIWVKSTEAGGNLGLISRWQNSGGTFSWVVTWENTGMNWYMAGLSTLSAAALSQNDGKWHHLCGVYNKVTAKLYMDGIERASIANTGDYSATTQPLVIGTYATSQDWDGQWRSFGLWCRPLQPNEVALLASDPAAMYRLERKNTIPISASISLISGSGSVSISGSGALTGIGVINASGGMSLSGTATITGVGVAAGSGTVSLNATGTITGVGVITGSTTLTLSAAGDLSSPVLIAGSAAMTLACSGSITGVGVMAGSTSITFGASATIVGMGVVSGATSLSLTAAAAISGIVDISGAASITISGAASIHAIGVMSAAGTLAISGSADVTGIGVIAGTSGLTLAAAADISGVVNLSGSAGISLAAEGDIIAVGVMEGAASLTIIGSAAVVGVAYVEGTTTIALSASGTISAIVEAKLSLCANGVSMLSQYYVIGSLGAEYRVHSEGSAASFTIVWGE